MPVEEPVPLESLATNPQISEHDLFNSAFDWEPRYSNRFIMSMGNVPAFLIKASARPSMTNGSIVLDHINIDRKLKGKSRWQDISMTLYDSITPSGAQSVMDWIRLHHESATGRDGYSTMYKKNLTLKSLSGLGEEIEEWTLKGAFITDCNWGSHDWANEEVVQIELTIQYDYAFLH